MFKGGCPIEKEEQDYISQIISQTQAEMMKQLKKHKLIKPIENSPYQRTEKLLYNYNQFKKAIQNKQELIAEIESEGLARRSKDLVIMSGNHNMDTSTDAERAEAKIEVIKASINKIKGFIKLIDNALGKIRTDNYFDIIRMKYFEGFTHEDISYELGCDVSTVNRNKTRLINILKIYLFLDDSIVEFFDYWG